MAKNKVNKNKLATNEQTSPPSAFDEYTPVVIRRRISDAPVPIEAVLPLFYLLSNNGNIVRKGDVGPQVISPYPLFITELSCNKSTNIHYVTLTWKADNGWHNLQVERCDIATKANIVKLANYNFPVTSLNANSLIAYLHEYEQINTKIIPRTLVESRLGWTEDMSGFLWGHSYLTDAPKEQTSSHASVVRFKGADQGDEQFANGFHQKGNFSSWTFRTNEALEYPDVAFAFYTSLAAPVLPILGVDNFTLELCAPSSSGKTTALMLAASAWGNPSLQAGSFINTWNGTDNRIGRVAALLNGLPLFLDETKLARLQNKKNRFGSDLVTDTIYMIASGLDKGRATLHGSDRVQPFRTILFSTGESPSLDLSTDGGSRGRIIDLWGNPFLKTDSESKAVVSRIKLTIKDHYGHAGPCLMQFILDNRSQWSLWKSAYEEVNRLFTQSDEMTPIEMRLGEYFAAVATAIPIIHAAIPGLQRTTPVRQLLESVWNRARSEAASSDIASQALQCIDDWINDNGNRIYSPASVSRGINWSGGDFDAYCDLKDDDDWTFIGFTKSKLDALLKSNGFNPNEIIRLWNEKGWLVTNGSSKGYQRQVAITGTSNGSWTKKINLYCLSKECLVSTSKSQS